MYISKIVFTTVVFLGSISTLIAQIDVIPSVSPEQLVEDFVGMGVEYSNVTFFGDPRARGLFLNGENTNLGLNSGVMLSTGKVADVKPSLFSSIRGTVFNNPGHEVLDIMCGFCTSDAVGLSFDFIPLSDTLSCQFVFSSNEYVKDIFVVGDYNDVFGYFISGPNPAGGVYEDENIALVPGTQEPVSVKTINNVVPNSAYPGYPHHPEFYVDNGSMITIKQYGFTVVLTAKCAVVPCASYHIDFLLADASDAKYDSNIFLASESFTTGKVKPEVTFLPDSGDDMLIEGCVDAHVELKLLAKRLEEWKMPLEIKGSALRGVDYTGIPDTLVVPSMASSVAFDVHALMDDMVEGVEDIQVIYPEFHVCSPMRDTLVLQIKERDVMTVAMPHEIMVCEGDTLKVVPELTGGRLPLSFQWGDGSTLSYLECVPSGSGWMSLTVRDALCSEVTDSVMVKVNPLPDVNLGDDITKCAEEPVLLDAGEGFALYHWSTGSDANSVQVTAPGLYWVEVENEAGCVDRDTILVTDNQLPEPHLGDDQSVCPYQLVNLTPGPEYLWYQWSTGATTPGIDVGEAGQYWVKVTDANGCMNSDTVVVTHYDVPDIDLGENDTVCAGTPVLLTLPGGYASYVWQDGTEGDEYEVTATGDYHVTVTNAEGCVTKDAVHIEFIDLPKPMLGDDMETCYPGQLTLSAGGGYASYLWQDGSTESVYVATVTGQYYVTVTNSYDCVGSDTLNFMVHPLPEVTLGSDDTVCSGNSVLLSPGSYAAYLWQDGSTEPEYWATEPGEYHVEVTDVNGCVNGDTMALVVNPLPDVNLGDDITKCAEEPVLLDAGEGFALYHWSTGSDANFVQVTAPGLYWVEVENEAGCVDRDTILVTDNQLPEPHLGDDQSVCPYQLVNLTPGPEYLWYQWSTGATTPGIDVGEAGQYWVKVTDANGCMNSDTVVVTHYDVPDIDLGENDTVCAGTPVLLTLPGGYASYVWQDGTEGDEYEVTATGDYHVTVANAEGCVTKDAVHIEFIDLPKPMLGDDAERCYPGQLTLSAGGGYASYLWQDGSTESVYVATVTGQYYVTVTNSYDCVGSDTLNFMVHPLPEVTLGSDDTVCSGNSVLLSPGSYAAYLWQDGSTEPEYWATEPGEYHVEVTDMNGCVNGDTMALVVNPLPDVDLGNDITKCAGEPVLLDAGEGFALYHWSTGSDANFVQVTAPGLYWVEVENEAGCVDRDTILVTDNQLPEPHLGDDQSVCPYQLVNLTPGPEYLWYQWSTGATTPGIDVGEAGQYWVKVTDANGCMNSDTVVVTHYDVPDIDLGENDTVCAGTPVLLTLPEGYASYVWQDGTEGDEYEVTATGDYHVMVANAEGCETKDTVHIEFIDLPKPMLGDDAERCYPGQLTLSAGGGYASYLWQDGSTESVYVATVTGQYYVTVTNSYDCVGSDTLNFMVHPLPEVTLGSDDTVCSGNSVLLSPGSYAAYLWQDGSTEPEYWATEPGEYHVEVTDMNGCVNGDTMALVVNPLPDVDLGDDITKCAGESVLLDAGVGFALYHWNTGSVGSFIQVTAPGFYWVEVENEAGCVDRDTILVTDNQLPEPHLGDDQSVCPYQLVNLTPGPEYLWYQWSTGATTPGIDVGEAGQYWVKVTDANGCMNSDTVVVTHYDVPDIDLGENDTVCAGTPVLLTLPEGYASYVWQDGTEGDEYEVTATGDYHVTVANAEGCETKDAVHIEFIDLPKPMLGDDAERCYPGQLTLSAGGGYASYLWQDGSTESVYVATVTGQYYVTVTNSYDCVGSDTLNFMVHPLPEVTLGSDDTVCSGNSVLLSPGSYAAYLWQDGSTEPEYWATEPGEYHVEVTDVNGCVNSDTMALVVNPLPDVDLGPDQAICSGDSYKIIAGSGFVSYTWQDGSHEQLFLAENEGWYWVDVENAEGCHKTDSLYLAVVLPPDISLGSDTIICEGTGILLEAGIGYAGYTWHDGSHWSACYVNGAGVYYVEVTNDMGCVASDTIIVGVKAGPEVDLGADTAVCFLESVVLDAGTGYQSYQWHNGAVSQQIEVGSQGWCWVKVEDDGGCFDEDSLFVTIQSLPPVNLPQEVEICGGDSLLLKAPEQMAAYVWSNGGLTDRCWVHDDGFYTVWVTGTNGCATGDTTRLFNRWIPKPDLGADRVMCEGESCWLDAGAGYELCIWTDGATSRAREITTAGHYGVKVYDDLGCMSGDSCVVDYNPVPEVTIGCDTLITCGSTATLTAHTLANHYLWSTGETSRQIIVEGNQRIAVEVEQNGCVGRDTLYVGWNDLCRVEYPTVFSPNRDGLNDYFQLINPPELSGFEMRIYNRLGMLVFHSSDPYCRWDGDFNGMPCPVEVYYAHITGKCQNGFFFNQTVDITLLR